MDKFAFDFDGFEKEINKPKSFKYDDVKHRLVRVAFDVVRFMDANEDIDGLWQIQKTDDGEVIVAMYSDPIEKSASVSSNWHVFPDRAKTSINIFYKNSPIKRLSSTELGIDSKDLPSICKDAETKLSINTSFRDSLLNELNSDERLDLYKNHPELKA